MNVKSIAMADWVVFFFFFCLGKGYVRVSVIESFFFFFFYFAEKINWIVTGSATRM
jgi:hypothetical protein